jgi:hypothetical protein
MYENPDWLDRLFLWMTHTVETMWVVTKWPRWLRRLYLVTWPVSMPLRLLGLITVFITVVITALLITLVVGGHDNFRDLWNDKAPK